MLKTYSVSQINEYIKESLNEDAILSEVMIEGELSFVSVKKTNLMFFTIKDEFATLDGIYFHTDSNFEVGQRVNIFGKIDYYIKSGKISFIAKRIKAIGQGLLYQEFLQLKDKLQKEGLFDKKKSKPQEIKRIAMITSMTGAVLHDFLSIAKIRKADINLFLFPAQMQGTGCEDSIIKQLKIISKQNIEFDAVVIARGGGSSEDLRAFNGENLAREIVKCPYFTVSAVGHETDITLCDLASDQRAGTPSIAAQILVKDCSNDYNLLLSEIDNLFFAIDKKYKINFDLFRNLKINLEHLANAMIKNGKNEIAIYVGEMCSAIEKKQQKQEFVFSELLSKLNVLSPMRLLSSGYSKIYKSNQLISSVKEVVKDDFVDIYIKDGKIKSKIIEIEEINYEEK